MTWINNLSDGQFTVLILVIAVAVFIPGYYATRAIFNRYGRRAVPHVIAFIGACAVSIVVLVTILIIGT